MLLAGCLLTLGSCASRTQIAVTDGGCVEFDRITFDRLKDTTETIAQVKQYDARRDAVCGEGK